MYICVVCVVYVCVCEFVSVTILAWIPQIHTHVYDAKVLGVFRVVEVGTSLTNIITRVLYGRSYYFFALYTTSLLRYETIRYMPRSHIYMYIRQLGRLVVCVNQRKSSVESVAPTRYRIVISREVANVRAPNNARSSFSFVRAPLFLSSTRERASAQERKREFGSGWQCGWVPLLPRKIIPKRPCALFNPPRSSPPLARSSFDSSTEQDMFLSRSVF